MKRPEGLSAPDQRHAVVLPFGARRGKGWTPQDRADLERVRHVLRAAGLDVDTDEGVTDEGDPWFVIYRPQDDEVLVHIARVDGRYVIDGPALRRPERGGSLRELVERYAARQPLLLPLARANSDKVLLHPAVLLAALAATLVVLSKGEAWAEEFPAEGAPLSPAGKPPPVAPAVPVHASVEPPARGRGTPWWELGAAGLAALVAGFIDLASRVIDTPPSGELTLTEPPRLIMSAVAPPDDRWMPHPVGRVWEGGPSEDRSGATLPPPEAAPEIRAVAVAEAGDGLMAGAGLAEGSVPDIGSLSKERPVLSVLPVRPAEAETAGDGGQGVAFAGEAPRAAASAASVASSGVGGAGSSAHAFRAHAEGGGVAVAVPMGPVADARGVEQRLMELLPEAFGRGAHPLAVADAISLLAKALSDPRDHVAERVHLVMATDASTVMTAVAEAEVAPTVLLDAAAAGLSSALTDISVPMFDEAANTVMAFFVRHVDNLAMMAYDREVLLFDAADVGSGNKTLKTMAWAMPDGTIVSILGAVDDFPSSLLMV